MTLLRLNSILLGLCQVIPKSLPQPLSFRRWKSSLANYTVEEIQIPLPKGNYLAAKLWSTNPNPNASVTNPTKRSPIICGHGWLDNAGSFDPLLSILFEDATDLTALAVDYPGHGHSSHSALTHYDTFVDGIMAILRANQFMGWEKVTLLGHSLGAVISYIFAGTFPEYTDRYIAIDALHPVPSETVKSLRRTLKSVLEIEKKLENGRTPEYTYDEILKKTYDGRKGEVSLDGCKNLLKRGSVQLPNGKYSFTHDLRLLIASGAGRFTQEQNRNIGLGITCPVCVIKGDPGQDYEPRADFIKSVDHLRTISKHLEFHMVPGQHHFHLNEPGRVAPIIKRFLELKF